MEERKRLIVRGFVQGVGYRAFVRFMASRYGIKGKVRNLENGDVEIIATADEKSMEMFIKSINIHAESPFEPDVHDTITEEYTGNEDFESFYVDYTYDMSVAEKEMIERSEIGILAFGWMGKYLGNKIDKVSEKVDRGFSEVGEKIDRGFSEVGEKIDTVSGKIDKVNEKLDNLTEKTESGFGRTYKKLDEISSKLDANTEKTTELQREMTDKFDYLDVKYGEFSATLKSMLDRFDNLERDVKEIKDAFLKLVDYITEKG